MQYVYSMISSIFVVFVMTKGENEMIEGYLQVKTL